ncbi:hypothetical protein [uncultured Brachyspira sp.]|uniref:hypothetical protein n=1 Tax=uncultured Brachyspira sp. TaxID=221953 RepID=UPI0025F5A337|nr:hypothetical protein [uncultured Brachyspira sp.]
MKILFLVLFFLIMSLSCKQNPRSMLSSPPIVEDKITNNNTGSSNTNSGGIIDNDLNSGSGYGYYDVSVLENNGTIKTVKYRISDTDKLLEAYSNMILNTDKTPKFELSKNDDTETYTFDSNLDLKVKVNKSTVGTTTARDKKFRGVCLVIIYPDATDTTAATKTANSSLLGCYTIAGIYREIKGNETTGGVATRAMKKSEKFQNAGYDELIILRTDKLDDTKNTYRADILFDDDKWISVYNYDPDRTFEKQNTNFIFKRATQ